MKTAQGPTALLVCAHPVWNVPPLFNVARALGPLMDRVLIVGYHKDGLPDRQRLQRGVWIVRLRIRARELPIPVLRKGLAVFEFLRRARVLIERVRPELLITFNEPASLLQKAQLPDGTRRTAWMLEYPEFTRMGRTERWLQRHSARCWPRADAVVAPTRERLALHTALEPACLRRRGFVIHNSPSRTRTAVAPAALSPRAREAIATLDSARARGLLAVIYTGAVGDLYAVDRAIEGVGRVPGTFLLILGKKHPLAEAEVGAALARCADPARVAWVDEIPYAELQAVLPQADLGFGTYLGDTLNTRFSAPGKLYEYLKAGVALLTDDQCCIESEARAADCAFFFPAPAETAGVAAALERALTRRTELAALRERAIRLFDGILCLERQIAPYLEWIRPITKRATVP